MVSMEEVTNTILDTPYLHILITNDFIRRMGAVIDRPWFIRN